MLSVLIETRNDEEALARTLASLVGAAVEGVVRDVIVCDGGSTDQTQQVADHAGCQFLAAGGITAGIQKAKGEWLLLLEPGAKPVEGWTEFVITHVAEASTPARFTRASYERGSFFARLFSGKRPLADALLIRKGQAVVLSKKAGSAEALAQAVSAKQLRAELSPAPPR
jgi:hypothetical protein